MLSGSPTATSSSAEGPLRKYTPLPLSQIAILLFLRFCEAASTFVIFPFLNEVLMYFKPITIDLTKGIRMLISFLLLW